MPVIMPPKRIGASARQDTAVTNRRITAYTIDGACTAAEGTAQRGATDFSAGFIRAEGEYPDALVGAEIRAINLFGRLHF